MSVDWRDLLAAKIESEPVLWDVTHPDYYRNDRKNIAWDRICDRLCELGHDVVVPELKREWKSMRDAPTELEKKPQSGSTARPIHGMRRSLSFLNTARVSGPRMTNVVNDDDNIDITDENESPPPAFLGRRKEEWARKLPGPSSSKKIEDSRREGDLTRSESPIPRKKKILEESTPTSSSTRKLAVTQAMDAVKSCMAELSADDEYIHFGACIGHILKSEPKEEARAKMIAILELAVDPPNPPQDAYQGNRHQFMKEGIWKKTLLCRRLHTRNLSSSCYVPVLRLDLLFPLLSFDSLLCRVYDCRNLWPHL